MNPLSDQIQNWTLIKIPLYKNAATTMDSWCDTTLGVKLGLMSRAAGEFRYVTDWYGDWHRAYDVDTDEYWLYYFRNPADASLFALRWG